MSDTFQPAPAVIPAATVIVFRHGVVDDTPELLMVQRAKAMRFAGGAAVFPGGRIDPEDRELAARIAPDRDPEWTAAKIAAIRETLEETGLAIGLTTAVSAADAVAARAMLSTVGALGPVLDAFGWTLDLTRLIPFARWCPMFDGSFDTYFFLADLGTGAVDVTVDATENTRLFWVSATEALEQDARGEIKLIFPTRCNLHRLAQFAGFAQASAQAQAISPRRITPSQVERDGDLWLTIPDDLGYPMTGQPMAAVKRG